MIALWLLAALAPDRAALTAVERKLPKAIAAVKDKGLQELMLRVTSNPTVARTAAKEHKCGVLAEAAKKNKPLVGACAGQAVWLRALKKKHAAATCWTVDYAPTPSAGERHVMVALEPGTNDILGLWLFDGC